MRSRDPERYAGIATLSLTSKCVQEVYEKADSYNGRVMVVDM